MDRHTHLGNEGRDSTPDQGYHRPHRRQYGYGISVDKGLSKIAVQSARKIAPRRPILAILAVYGYVLRLTTISGKFQANLAKRFVRQFGCRAREKS